LRYWYSYPELKSRDTLRRLLQKYKTISLVAGSLGCSPHSVKSAIRYHGLAFPTDRQAERIIARFK